MFTSEDNICHLLLIICGRKKCKLENEWWLRDFECWSGFQALITPGRNLLTPYDYISNSFETDPVFLLALFDEQ